MFIFVSYLIISKDILNETLKTSTNIENLIKLHGTHLTLFISFPLERPINKTRKDIFILGLVYGFKKAQRSDITSGPFPQS